jgi:hypothetical protein
MVYVISLVDSIEDLFDNAPDKRKKSEYQEWKKTINLLIEQVNKSCKFKMYEKIK